MKNMQKELKIEPYAKWHKSILCSYNSLLIFSWQVWKLDGRRSAWVGSLHRKFSLNVPPGKTVTSKSTPVQVPVSVSLPSTRVSSVFTRVDWETTTWGNWLIRKWNDQATQSCGTCWPVCSSYLRSDRRLSGSRDCDLLSSSSYWNTVTADHSWSDTQDIRTVIHVASLWWLACLQPAWELGRHNQMW